MYNSYVLRICKFFVDLARILLPVLSFAIKAVVVALIALIVIFVLLIIF